VTKDELCYNSWLTQVNFRLGRYVVRLVDEASGLCTTEYTMPLAKVEAMLGHDLMELGSAALAKSSGVPHPAPTTADQAPSLPNQ
jgi:hypothetical protein